MIAARRLTSVTLVSLCVLAGVLALLGASAQAEVTHPYLCQITGSSILSSTECNGIGNSVPGGSFGNPQGVAVNSAGQVYVSDGANRVLDVFDSLGNYTAQITGTAPSAPFTDPFGVALDGSGNVWVADVGPGLMDKFSPAGSFLAQGTGAGHWQGGYTRSVAFSSASNHLYVADSNHDDLWVLNADGSYNSDIPGSEATWGGGCCFIYAAADNSGGAAAGDVYVSSSRGSVTRIDGAGSLAGFSGSASYISGAQLTGTPSGPFGELTGVTVDSAGHLYVLDNGRGVVDEFDAAGVFVGQTSGGGTPRPSGAFSSLQGIAVSAAGKVYVADGGSPGVVDVFGGNVVLAEVSSGAAGSVGKTTATLEGSVNPDGTSVTGCVFEYRSEAEVSFAHTAGCAQTLPLTGSAPVAVSANVSGLTANTTYRFRLAASNANGTNYGSPQTFTTAAAVDALSTGPAEAITPSGAKLTGALSPDGTDAHYYFQYGTEASYGSVSPALPGTDAGSASASVPAETTLSGLAANTTYHYRLAGVNAFGTTYGEDATFTTSGPPAIGAESSSGVGSFHATLGAQINPDGFATNYRFEYGTSASYGTSVPVPDGEIPAGFSEQAVELTVKGLLPSTTYHFRVVASNSVGTTFGPDQTYITQPPASIESESVNEVTSTGATLDAQINPIGTASTYRFEYLTEADFKANGESFTGPNRPTLAPIPDGMLGEGETTVTVSQRVQGLQSQTVYRYRAVALNSLGAVDGAPLTFTTQAATTGAPLPDSRQLQLVSPPDKHGALLQPLSGKGLTQAAADGSGIAYVANGSVEADPAGNANYSQVIAARGPAGWSSRDIATPHSAAVGASGQGNEYKAISSDLSLALAEPLFQSPHGFLPLSPAASENTLYLRSDFTGSEPCSVGCYRPLVTGCPPVQLPCSPAVAAAADVPPGTAFNPLDAEGLPIAGLEFRGATSDLSHVVFQDSVPLAPGGGQDGLYEYSAGKPPAEELQLLYELPKNEGGGEASGGAPSSVTHQLSDDGSVFFSANGHLYLHDPARDETVRVHVAPGAASEGEPGFLYAASDGSRVLFSDSTQLTTAAGGGVYECFLAEVAGQLTCTQLTLTGLSFEGTLIGGSEDADYLYFATNGGALYVDHREGVAWRQTPIAALAPGDSPDWDTTVAYRTARVSPNGEWLTFMSERPLTGYDNRDAVSGEPDEEVYLYHAPPGGEAAAGRLVCASCNPTGARPHGVEFRQISFQGEGTGLAQGGGNVWGEHRWIAANLPTWTGVASGVYQSRYLSGSGRLFFNSSDALVPADTNATEDVYQYEPPRSLAGAPASDSCTVASPSFSAGSEGCLDLVSSGTSKGESAFLDASESGDDVFFITAAALTGQDVDSAVDVYDAHACSAASPCLPEPPPPPPLCAGDACQQPVAPPVEVTPGSLTFKGPGNLAPLPAVKPKSLTRAQRLAKALRACHSKRASKRRFCERQARRRYASKASRTSQSKPLKSSRRAK